MKYIFHSPLGPSIGSMHVSRTSLQPAAAEMMCMGASGLIQFLAVTCSLQTGQRRSYECSCASRITSTPYLQNSSSRLCVCVCVCEREREAGGIYSNHFLFRALISPGSPLALAEMESIPSTVVMAVLVSNCQTEQLHGCWCRPGTGMACYAPI